MGIVGNSTLTRLKYQHEPLLDWLNNGDLDVIRQKAEEGKWSIFENIAHLTRYQKIFLERIDKILTRDDPSFSRYNANQDQEFPEWLLKTPGVLKEEISRDRKVIFKKITSLSEEELKRTGKHPKFGRMKVLDWTEFFLLHEAHHLYTIFSLEKQLHRN